MSEQGDRASGDADERLDGDGLGPRRQADETSQADAGLTGPSDPTATGVSDASGERVGDEDTD